MERTLTVAQVREYDRRATEVYGIPGLVLMENAGRAAAEAILELVPPVAPVPQGERRAEGRPRAVVLAGSGNNGGDGYVVARHLLAAGLEVELGSTATRASLRGEAALFRGICERLGLAIHELVTGHQLEREHGRWAGAQVLVDAVLGTGFQGELRPHVARVLAAANALPRRPAEGPRRVGEAVGTERSGPARVAIDVPSGLEADTGRAAPEAFRADLTVTFVAPKPGFVLADGPRHVGRVLVRGIGAPDDLLERGA